MASAKAALAAYGGELLPLDVYEPWAEQTRGHLTRLHRELLRQGGDWHQILAADPTDEEAHLALIRRHTENGNRGAALRQFEWLDRALRQDLGLGPSEKALALRDQIVTVAAGERRRSSAPPPARPVGRDREVAARDSSGVHAGTGRSGDASVSGPPAGGESFLGWLTRRVSADLCRRRPMLLVGLAEVYREEIDRIFDGAGLDWGGGPADVVAKPRSVERLGCRA